MAKVADQTSPDGQRVIETDGDGNETVRPATLAEQVEFMYEDVLAYVVRMVPMAQSGSIDTSGSGGEATLTIKLSANAAEDATFAKPATASGTRSSKAGTNG